jgi:DNA sulfur modification protein DndB
VNTKTLLLPALRASMGDWRYYISFMQLREIASRISFAEEIHSSNKLNDLLQRQLTGRSKAIAQYLQTQEQRFFNALVIATYGGNPEWYELDVRNPEEHLEPVPNYLRGSIGFLKFEGTERMFAIDGQHRVAGIRQALRTNEDLGDEEVCAIFVAGVNQQHRSDDPEGYERTRRLFSTLNRYAKPVNLKDIIALDEDDTMAILTRELVETDPLFHERVSIAQTKSIPVTNTRDLTTISTLYDALDKYFRKPGREWSNFKRLRPSEHVIDEYRQRTRDLWAACRDAFPPLQELADSPIDSQVAGKYRNRTGGHLLFRPIGLLMLVQVIRTLRDRGYPLHQAVEQVSKVPMLLSERPWVQLLWNPVTHTMITGKDNQLAAARLLSYGVGLDVDVAQLKHLLQGLQIDETVIQQYV